MAGGARRRPASLRRARSPGARLGCKQHLSEGLRGLGTAWGAAVRGEEQGHVCGAQHGRRWLAQIWHCWAELALVSMYFSLGISSVLFLKQAAQQGVRVHDLADDLSGTFVSLTERLRGKIVYFLEHGAELLANS